MDLKYKTVSVIGLGERTGVETVKFLAEQEAEIIVSDTRTQEDLAGELAKISDYNFKADLAGHSEKLILKSDLIVVSPGVPAKIPVLKEAIASGIEVISEIELAYRFNKAKLVAITGTNGKTTTTTLVGQICSDDYPGEVVVGGNIGRPLIKDLPYLSSSDLAIAEISSFQLELVDTFRPDISLFLNLTPDHLTRHGGFKNYLAAKKELLKKQSETDYTILNYDDPIIKGFSGDTKGQIIYFSRQEEVTRGVFVKDRTIISNIFGREKEIINTEELVIKGPHNLENVLAAVAVAELLEIRFEVLIEKLRSFSGVEHRIEFLDAINDVEYVNDSKGTNPAATIKALQTFKQAIILIAGGKDKGSDFYKLLEIGQGKIKSLILIGETANKIKKTAVNMGYQDIHKVKTMQEAVKLSNKLSVADDVVLLSPACSSLDMFSDYEERGNIFKEAVNSLRGK